MNIFRERRFGRFIKLLCIVTKGTDGKGDFKEYNKAFSVFQDSFSESYHIEKLLHMLQKLLILQP